MPLIKMVQFFEILVSDGDKNYRKVVIMSNGCSNVCHAAVVM